VRPPRISLTRECRLVAFAATGPGPRLAGLGLVDGKLAAAVVLPIQGGDRRLSFGVAAHLDKPETLAAAGLAVLDHLGTLHRAVRRAQLLKVSACRVIAQIPNIQLAAHVIAPIASWGCRTRRLLSGFESERGRGSGPEGRRGRRQGGAELKQTHVPSDSFADLPRDSMHRDYAILFQAGLFPAIAVTAFSPRFWEATLGQRVSDEDFAWAAIRQESEWAVTFTVPAGPGVRV
jgi:hypothetical protein